MTIIIHCKNHVRVIHPTPLFDGSVSKLVEAVTQSDYNRGIRNFEYYERG